MVCKANNCTNNADGYCMCSSYVSINSDGECDLIELHNKDFNNEITKCEYNFKTKIFLNGKRFDL